jgi:hypothetical protein
MVRNGGLPDTQAFAQLSDTEARTSFRIAAMALAAFGQPQEDRHAVRVREGFEDKGHFQYFHISKAIDISD